MLLLNPVANAISLHTRVLWFSHYRKRSLDTDLCTKCRTNASCNGIVCGHSLFIGQSGCRVYSFHHEIVCESDKLCIYLAVCEQNCNRSRSKCNLVILVCTFHDGCKQGIDRQIFNRKSISRKITEVVGSKM